MTKPLALLACLALTVAAATDEVLTNDDVVALLDAGLPPGVVVAKIATSRTDFDTSVDQLVTLGKAGVDAEVLEAMVSAGASSAPAIVRVGVAPSAAVKTNFDGTPCEVPGIFVADGGVLRDMDLTPATQIRSGFGLLSGFTFGLVPVQTKAAVHGARASTRTARAKPEFWFCFEEAAAGLSYQALGAVNPAEFLLVAFDVNERRQERTFPIGWFHAWSVSQSGAPRRQLRTFTYVKVKPGIYRVTPEAALAPGEYAFYSPSEARFGPAGALAIGGVPGSKLFAFGVDES